MSCHFILCLHNHQPVGNFDHVFEWGLRDCYKKTLELLAKYPEFKFSVHHSGPLLEWIEKHDPAYLDLLKGMVERGQVEIIGGGFYEPIFSVITESDIRGQIDMMQNYCEKHFGKKPTGFWTAERVWDPEIPRLVNGFGLDYTILDDIHFRYAGIDENDLNGYFNTERLNYNLKVYPIDRNLRYFIPFQQPEVTVDYFKRRMDQIGHGSFVYGDDGEKFGMWPGTYKWVFEENWLVRFIETILKNDWIKTTHPGQYIADNKPAGRVYLTQGSYYELSEWALPAKVAAKLTGLHHEFKNSGREQELYPFLKGGVWNNFLIKYPETNALNKRMILLSNELGECDSKNTKIPEAKQELYRGECNCAYWHGLFGGIYLTNLRQALHYQMLLAEKLIRDCQGKKGISVTEKDIWNEGSNQLLIRDAAGSVMVTPAHGGAISEFGSYDKGINVFNVVARRYEAYHDTLLSMQHEVMASNEIKSIHDMVVVKELGLKRYLVYDDDRRYSFKDYVFTGEPTPEDFMFNRVSRSNSAEKNYNYSVTSSNDSCSIALDSGITSFNRHLDIKKEFVRQNGKNNIMANYQINAEKDSQFAVEINVNLLAAHEDNRYYDADGLTPETRFLDSIGLIANATKISLVDDYNKLRVDCSTDKACRLIRYPIFTVSQSDSGFEKNYQGSCLIFIYNLKSGNNQFSIDIEIK